MARFPRIRAPAGISRRRRGARSCAPRRNARPGPRRPSPRSSRTFEDVSRTASRRERSGNPPRRRTTRRRRVLRGAGTCRRTHVRRRSVRPIPTRATRRVFAGSPGTAIGSDRPACAPTRRCAWRRWRARILEACTRTGRNSSRRPPGSSSRGPRRRRRCDWWWRIRLRACARRRRRRSRRCWRETPRDSTSPPRRFASIQRRDW